MRTSSRVQRGHLRGLLVTSVLGLGAALACSRRVPEPEGTKLASPSSPNSVTSSALPATSARALGGPTSPKEPALLLSLPSSAYQASLALDDEAIYVLTADAAYRVASSGAVQKTALDLGLGPMLTRRFLVFWSKGAIWRAEKQGGKPSRVAPYPHQPQYFVASGDDFAWLDHSEEGAYAIRTLRGSKAYDLYVASGKIDAMTMLRDILFFVERAADDSWRVGRVRLAGGAPEFAPPKTGRSPSMLAGTNDVVYYDGNQREVRALSADLQREQTLFGDFICSPIAVSERVYCGQVQGLYELSRDGKPPRLLSETRAATAALVADRSRVVWLSDAGPDRLALKMLKLSDARP